MHLNKAKMISFVLYVFYHDFFNWEETQMEKIFTNW